MTARRPRPRQQRGAAILLAMLIMTLVTTIAAGMVWLQWRGIEVESAERARAQGEWLLNASLDWGNLILKSSIRNGDKEDDLGQPWATPLAETKLSSFLSADGSHAEEGGPEAFLSGQITDAQSKYNLYNLITSSTIPSDEVQRLGLLCSAIGVSADVANTIAAGMRASHAAQQLLKEAPGQKDSTHSVLMPIAVRDLVWFGIDPKIVHQLEPFVALLPASVVTNINVNTAPAEVLMAAYPGISRAQAQQIVLKRQQKPFTATVDATLVLGEGKTGYTPPKGMPPAQDQVTSNYFEIYGQLRYEQHVIRERSVVFRKSPFDPVQVLRRERLPPDAS